METGKATIYIMSPRNNGALMHPKGTQFLSEAMRFLLDERPDYEGNKNLVSEIQKINPEVTADNVEIFLENELDSILKLDYEFAQRVHLYDVLETEVFNIEPYGKGLLEFLNDCDIMFYVVSRKWNGVNEIELTLEPFHRDNQFSVSKLLDKSFA